MTPLSIQLLKVTRLKKLAISISSIEIKDSHHTGIQLQKDLDNAVFSFHGIKSWTGIHE